MDESQKHKKSLKIIILFQILALGASITILVLLITSNNLAFSDKHIYKFTTCAPIYLSTKYNNADLFTNIIFISTVILNTSLIVLIISTFVTMRKDSYQHNLTFGWLCFTSSVSTLATVPILGYSLSLMLEIKDCTIQWNGMSIIVMLSLGASSLGLCLMIFLLIVCSCSQEQKLGIYKVIDVTMPTQQKQNKLIQKQQIDYRHNHHNIHKELQEHIRNHHNINQNYINSNKPQPYFRHKRKDVTQQKRTYNYQKELQPNYTFDKPFDNSRSFYDSRRPQIIDPFIQDKIQRNPNYKQESVVHNLHPTLRHMNPRRYIDYMRDDEEHLYRQQKRYLGNLNRNMPHNRNPSPNYFNHNHEQRYISKDPYISPKSNYERNRYK